MLLVNFNINDETKEKLGMIGYEAAIKFFKHELPQKQKLLAEYYDKLYAKTQEFEKNIIKGDIKAAKVLLGELFELLADVKKLIDSQIYKRIKKFKNLFNENLYCGFFGREKLKEKRKIKKETEIIKEILSQKCKEFSQQK